jgi:hypothetical protein
MLPLADPVPIRQTSNYDDPARRRGRWRSPAAAPGASPENVA